MNRDQARQKCKREKFWRTNLKAQRSGLDRYLTIEVDHFCASKSSLQNSWSLNSLPTFSACFSSGSRCAKSVAFGEIAGTEEKLVLESRERYERTTKREIKLVGLTEEGYCDRV